MVERIGNEGTYIDDRWASLKARVATRRAQIARGEIAPPPRDANGNIIPTETPRRFTIRDIGLHSEAQIS